MKNFTFILLMALLGCGECSMKKICQIKIGMNYDEAISILDEKKIPIIDLKQSLSTNNKEMVEMNMSGYKIGDNKAIIVSPVIDKFGKMTSVKTISKVEFNSDREIVSEDFIQFFDFISTEQNPTK